MPDVKKVKIPEGKNSDVCSEKEVEVKLELSGFNIASFDVVSVVHTHVSTYYKAGDSHKRDGGRLGGFIRM